MERLIGDPRADLYDEDWAMMDENNPGAASNGHGQGDADFERVLLESMKQNNAHADHAMMDEEEILQQVMEESRKAALQAGRR